MAPPTLKVAWIDGWVAEILHNLPFMPFSQIKRILFKVNHSEKMVTKATMDSELIVSQALCSTCINSYKLPKESRNRCYHSPSRDGETEAQRG